MILIALALGLLILWQIVRTIRVRTKEHRMDGCDWHHFWHEIAEVLEWLFGHHPHRHKQQRISVHLVVKSK